MNKKFVTIIFSVLFSIILWGSITLSGTYFTTLKVPVKLTNLHKGYAIEDISTKETNLRVKGEGWKLASLLLSNGFEFFVSTGSNHEYNSVKLSKSLSENPWLSSSLQVFDISPDTMTFRLEKIQKKRFKIKADITLNFRTNFGIISPLRVIPDSVTVYGTRSMLSGVDYIPTLPRTFENLDENVSLYTSLRQIDGFRYEKNSCEITFEVQRIADRKFEDIPIETTNVPDGYTITLLPGRMAVVLRGGINVVGKIKPEEITVAVDYNKVLLDTLGYAEPVLKIPEHTTVIDVNPPKLKYIIKKF
ncbi:MAG: hypothetical protein WCJ01_04895 [Ignavibacteria bacterium]